MGKLKIDDLHYIVMEGGGARGNTYVGAIKALETEFKKKLLSDTNISTPKLSPEKLQEIRNSKDINRFPVMSIMDFEEEDSEGKKIPIIRGLAGGSAGSITSFALSLGLSSDEILNEVLKYDFTSFLSETHAGKYRMIDENSNLVIGEDSNEEVGGETKEKIGEVTTTNKLALFKYQLNKNKTNIHGSNSKFVKRNIIINFSLKVIVDGLLINIDQFSKFIRTILGNDYSNPSVLGKEWNKLMSVIRNDSNKASNYLIHTLINRIINMLIFAALRIFTPLKKIGANPTAGLLFDRGFFSGFQVREFFYDMMIFAATRDTLFQRKLIEYYKGTKYVVSIDDLSYKEFKLGKRNEIYSDLSVQAKLLFTHLQNLTFREYFEITGIDFAAAVSNYTTKSPLYFSDTYTPFYRVLEAVGTSMSIPPAIRPVYNESDVFFDGVNEGEAYKIEFPRNNISKKIDVLNDMQANTDSTKNHRKNFVNSKGEFSQSDYTFYEYLVKKALQMELVEDENTYIDLNNVIELNTFLPKLMKIVIGEKMTNNKGEIIKDANGNVKRTKEKLKNNNIKVDGITYEVDDDLLRFYYNAQFKGLQFDAGYFCNIPYSYFRDSDSEELKAGVLAFKLDRSFPPHFQSIIDKKLENYLSFEKQISDKLDSELLRINNEKERINIELNTVEWVDFDEKFSELIRLVENEYRLFIKNEFDNKQINKNRIERKEVLIILEQWLKRNRKSNQIKPWAKKKSILLTAFEGFSFGSERGQIKRLSDHSHIIPLYDFGVGTYDFKLEKVVSEAKLAREMAEKDVTKYFNESFK